jgi:hypothetical protein
MKTGREFIYKPKRKVTGNKSKYMNPSCSLLAAGLLLNEKK